MKSKEQLEVEGQLKKLEDRIQKEQLEVEGHLKKLKSLQDRIQQAVEYFSFTEELKEFQGGSGYSEQVDELKKLLKRLSIYFVQTSDTYQRIINRKDPLRVGVVGQFAAGKSTLINGFLGSDYLPMGPTPETHRWTEIRYGEKIRYFKGTKSREARQEEEISEEEFRKLASTEPDQIDKNKKYVLMEIPSKHLYNLVIIDSPGLNTDRDSDTSITEYIISQESEVLLWVSQCSQLEEPDLKYISNAPVQQTVVVFNRAEAKEDIDHEEILKLARKSEKTKICFVYKAEEILDTMKSERSMQSAFECAKNILLDKGPGYAMMYCNTAFKIISPNGQPQLQNYKFDGIPNLSHLDMRNRLLQELTDLRNELVPHKLYKLSQEILSKQKEFDDKIKDIADEIEQKQKKQNRYEKDKLSDLDDDIKYLMKMIYIESKSFHKQLISNLANKIWIKNKPGGRDIVLPNRIKITLSNPFNRKYSLRLMENITNPNIKKEFEEYCDSVNKIIIRNQILMQSNMAEYCITNEEVENYAEHVERQFKETFKVLRIFLSSPYIYSKDSEINLDELTDNIVADEILTAIVESKVKGKLNNAREEYRRSFEKESENSLKFLNEIRG